MSDYRSQFISSLAKLWKNRLPDWKLGRTAPIPWSHKEHTFTNSVYFRSAGRVFHLIIEFTPKWPGAFTATIVVADSQEPFSGEAPPRRSEDLTSLPTGTYPIALFLQRQEIWWHLREEPAELVLRRTEDWYARSYQLPPSEIVTAAVEHFTEMFLTSVQPTLQKSVLKTIKALATARDFSPAPSESFLTAIYPDIEKLLPKEEIQVFAYPKKKSAPPADPTIRVTHIRTQLSVTCNEFNTQAENYIAAIIRLRNLCDAQ